MGDKASDWFDAIEVERIERNLADLRSQRDALDSQRSVLSERIDFEERGLAIKRRNGSAPAVVPASPERPTPPPPDDARRTPTAGLSDAILNLMQTAPSNEWGAGIIADHLSDRYDKRSTLTALSKLTGKGRLVRVSRGLYRLPASSDGAPEDIFSLQGGPLAR